MNKKDMKKYAPLWALPTRRGNVSKEEMKKKDAEIEYITDLLKNASPEKVHKLFISASTILG